MYANINKRLTVTIGIALTLLAGPGGCSKDEPATNNLRPALAFRIGTLSGIETDLYPGEIRARHETDHAFRISGKMTARLVDAGSVVKRGQPLARLDPQDTKLAADATNANAAAQALAVYPRVHWIAGGVPKEGGIEDLETFFPRMAKAYLIGQSAGDFSDTLRGKVAIAMAGNLEAAVKMAFADAKASGEPHPVVLLSPACASFDQFKSYEERGDQFKKFVAALSDGAGKRNGGAA